MTRRLINIPNHHIGEEIILEPINNAMMDIGLTFEGALALQMKLGAALADRIAAPKPPKLDVPQLLGLAAETFKERNKDYKAGHKVHAEILKSMFPDGVKFDDPDWAARFVIFNNTITKMVRYATSMQESGPGHIDSAHDLGVYSFILESLTREGKK